MNNKTIKIIVKIVIAVLPIIQDSLEEPKEGGQTA